MTATRMIRAAQVRQLLGGIGNTTLWRWVKEQTDFPRPIKLSEKVTVWKLAEIVAWRDMRAASINPPKTVPTQSALQSKRDELLAALRIAEAALADIGDADREPGDDVAWCEARAAEALPAVRAAISQATGAHS